MEGLENKVRVLPIFNMAGTGFYVDTRLNEFREVDAPWNRISMDEVREDADGVTGFVFDKQTKNVYDKIIDPDHIPEHVTLVIIPSLMELDPVGLARKSGLPDDEFIKKKDRMKEKKQLPEKQENKPKKGYRL